VSKRPNHQNKSDACCSCGHLYPTPADHEKPTKDELHVWQPNPFDPPQWICGKCQGRLVEDDKRL
jgi:uncharacterized CHY-type Zn-finger protein